MNREDFTPAQDSLESDVESVFKDMTCICNPEHFGPHQGAIHAYYSSHEGFSCVEGWFCEGHYQFWQENVVPRQRFKEMLGIPLVCVGCLRAFRTRKEFGSFHTL